MWAARPQHRARVYWLRTALPDKLLGCDGESFSLLGWGSFQILLILAALVVPSKLWGPWMIYLSRFCHHHKPSHHDRVSADDYCHPLYVSSSSENTASVPHHDSETCCGSSLICPPHVSRAAFSVNVRVSRRLTAWICPNRDDCFSRQRAYFSWRSVILPWNCCIFEICGN